MKKALVIFLVLACISTFVLVGCDTKQKGSQEKLLDSTINPNSVETIVLQSASGIQAAESMGFGKNNQSVAVNKLGYLAGAAEEEALAEQPAGVFEKEIGDIMAASDLLVNSHFTPNVEVSDREGYTIKTTLTFGEDTFTIYIAEFTQRNEAEEDDDEEEEEEEEIEISSTYKGIIILDNNEYEFVGESKVEREGEEVEEEIELKIIISENAYILIKQEFEVDGEEYEESYKYRFYENGEIVEEYKISKEVEGKEGELKIVKNGEVFKYKYYIEDEAEYVEIFNNSVKEIYRKIKEKDGTYTYVVVGENAIEENVEATEKEDADVEEETIEEEIANNEEEKIA